MLHLSIYWGLAVSKNKDAYIIKSGYAPPDTQRAIIIYANSKGSDEPAHPRSLVRTYAVHSRKRLKSGKLRENFSQRIE